MRTLNFIMFSYTEDGLQIREMLINQWQLLVVVIVRYALFFYVIYDMIMLKVYQQLYQQIVLN